MYNPNTDKQAGKKMTKQDTQNIKKDKIHEECETQTPIRKAAIRPVPDKPQTRPHNRSRQAKHPTQKARVTLTT